MEELENAGMVEQTEVDTASTDVNDTTTENNDINNEKQETKTFTQEQVNDFVRNRIDRERNSTYKRYGVKDRDELDSLIVKSQSYDMMREQYDTLKSQNDSLQRDLAFLRQNIEPTRQEDVLAYFKGKDLDFTEENLVEALRTHPEWLRASEVSDKPKYTFKQIGAERSYQEPKDEKKEVAKLFGIREI